MKLNEIFFDDKKRKWIITSDNEKIFQFNTKKEALFFKRGFYLLKESLKEQALIISNPLKELLLDIGRKSHFISSILMKAKEDIKNKLSTFLQVIDYDIIINLKLNDINRY